MNGKNKFSYNKHCHNVLFNNNRVSLETGNCTLVTAEVCEYALAAGRKDLLEYLQLSPICRCIKGVRQFNILMPLESPVQ